MTSTNKKRKEPSDKQNPNAKRYKQDSSNSSVKRNMLNHMTVELKDLLLQMRLNATQRKSNTTHIHAKLTDTDVPFVGVLYIELKDIMINFIRERVTTDVARNEQSDIPVLYGTSGSGKSRLFEEVANSFKDDNDIVCVGITFNSYASEFNPQKIIAEFIIRLIFALYCDHRPSFISFRKKWIDEFSYDLESEISINLIYKHILQPFSETKKFCLLIDEIMVTKFGRDPSEDPAIHENLYDIMREIVRSGVTGHPDKLYVIPSTLDVNYIFNKETVTKSKRNVKSFYVPILSFPAEVEQFVKEAIEANQWNFKSSVLRMNKQVAMSIRMLQGRPRLLLDFLREYNRNDESCSDILEEICKMQNSNSFTPEHLLALSLYSNKVEIRDKLSDVSISKLILEGQILQPSKQLGENNNVVSRPFPCIVSFLRILHLLNTSKKRILRQVSDYLTEFEMVVDGFEFEKFHRVMEILKREVLFSLANEEEKTDEIIKIPKVKNLGILNVEIGNEKIDVEGISIAIGDLYGRNALYIDSNRGDFSNDEITIFRFADLHTGRDMDYSFEETRPDDLIENLNALYSFFRTQKGFDMCYFILKNGILGMIFVENKYSIKYEGSTLDGAEIDKKHLHLQEIIKKFPFIKFYYHVFVSFQLVPPKNNILNGYENAKDKKKTNGNDKKKTNRKKVTFKNLIILQQDDLYAFYGPTWSDLLSFYAKPIDKWNMKTKKCIELNKEDNGEWIYFKDDDQKEAYGVCFGSLELKQSTERVFCYTLLASIDKQDEVLLGLISKAGVEKNNLWKGSYLWCMQSSTVHKGKDSKTLVSFGRSQKLKSKQDVILVEVRIDFNIKRIEFKAFNKIVGSINALPNKRNYHFGVIMKGSKSKIQLLNATIIPTNW